MDSTVYTDFKAFNLNLDPLQVLRFINKGSSPIRTPEGYRDYCPIEHDFKGKTLSISSNNIFLCYKCDARGDLIGLVAQCLNVSNQKAVTQLKENGLSTTSLDTGRHVSNYNAKEKGTASAEKKDSSEILTMVQGKWNSAKEGLGHPYLKLKKAGACPGLRYGHDARGNSSIVVPFRNTEGKLVTLQYVHTKGKFFLEGARQEDAFFSIGNIAETKKIYATEGLATAITIWKALGKETPVISFASVGRMETVIKAILKKYPNLEIIVCLETEKTSLKPAKKICNMPSVLFSIPNFKGMTNFDKERNSESTCTDYNDIISKCNQSMSVVTKQLKDIKKLTKIESDMVHSIESNQKPTATLNNEPPSRVNSQQKGKPIVISDAIDQCNFLKKLIDKVNRYNQTGHHELSGLSTGYNKLDEALDGIQEEHLITLAARTGVGKSWIALNLIKKISIDNREAVTYYSLEMSTNQILCRLFSLCSGISARKIRKGNLNKKELDKVIEASKKIKSSALSLSDCPSNSNLSTLLKNIDEEPAQTKFIIIDHLGLIKVHNNQIIGRVIEVGEITRSLKLAAKQNKLPIMFIAQLNRNADKDAPIRLSDLRESGSIEQDSDVVIFVHRSDYYNIDNKPGELELIIEKNRDGEQKITIPFFYDKNTWIIKENESLASKKDGQTSETKKLLDNQKNLTGFPNMSKQNKTEINDDLIKSLVQQAIEEQNNEQS